MYFIIFLHQSFTLNLVLYEMLNINGQAPPVGAVGMRIKGGELLPSWDPPFPFSDSPPRTPPLTGGIRPPMCQLQQQQCTINSLVNTPLVSIPWILLETHGNPCIHIWKTMVTVALVTHGNPWKPSPSGNPWKPMETMELF